MVAGKGHDTPERRKSRQAWPCRVYIEPDWRERVGPQNEFEVLTLEFSNDVAENSRLGCQIKITDALDGLVVRVPVSQK